MSKIRVGVFDSGLGGLSVARALLDAVPSASIIYFADIKHVPYGDRPPQQVHSFALGIVDHLISQGAGAVLMACNMSSALALDDARTRYPDIPILGVVEAGARAAVATGENVFSVLATAGTVGSGAYQRAVTALNSDARVIQTACPKFVPLIETGELDGPAVEQAVAEYLEPGLEQGAKVFILGCTHYPFLLPVLNRMSPEGTVFIDPAGQAVAEMVEIAGESIDTGTSSRYILSAPSETFRPVGSRFLGRPLPELELVDWSDDDTKVIAQPAYQHNLLCDITTREG